MTPLSEELNSIIAQIEPRILWLILIVITITTAILSSALYYHWHSYEIYVRHKVRIVSIYITGIIVTLLFSITMIMLFTSSS